MNLVLAWAIGALLGIAWVLWTAARANPERRDRAFALLRLAALVTAMLWPLALLGFIAAGLWLTASALVGAFARTGPFDDYWQAGGP